MVGLGFLFQNLGSLWKPMDTFCHSMNVDGVLVLLCSTF